jgi:serine/threonine protein kinase
VLGVGCSASVYQCYSTDTDQELAVKIFNITDESVKLTALQEVQILKLIRHENIVKFIGDRWTSTIAYLVMEKAPGMPLNDYLKSKQIITRVHVIQLLEAIAYLHS